VTTDLPGGHASAHTNALLRARLEEMTAAYEWMNQQTRRIHQEMTKVTGRAETKDGMVVATVGPSGKLLSLTLDPRASRRVSTEELAAAIVETVNRAGTQANSKAAAIMGPILPEGVSVDDVTGPSADPATWLPASPLTGEAFDAWWATIRKKSEGTR
jgi:DNA-binding protein YbaB